VHVCELILAFQTSMITMTVETSLAWTQALRSGDLRQKLPRPPRRLNIHQSRLEPRHRLPPLPLVTARRTTHARRPRSPSPSPLTQKPPSQKRTVPDLRHMHPRMEASTTYRIHPLLVLVQIRIPLNMSKRSAPMPAAPGRCTRFLLIHMERPQARQLVHLRQAVLRRYRRSRLCGLRK